MPEMDSKGLKERIHISFLATASLSSTLFLFTPFFLYFHNKSEFYSQFVNLLPLLLAVALLLTILPGAVLGFIKGKHHARWVALTTALAFLFWIQGIVFRWKMGVLTGVSLKSSNSGILGLIDIAVWLGILTTAWLGYRTAYKMVKYVAAIIIIVQALALLPHLLPGKNLAANPSVYVDETCKYQFSNKKNIIILVLDAFPADIFQEFVNEDPGVKEAFKDFTFFRNCLGGFPSTIPSVPLILSGKYYDNSESYRSFHRHVYLNNSLPRILTSKGYRVHVYARLNTIYLNPLVASNFNLKKQPLRKILREAATLIDVSLFKHVPYLMKKYIYNHHHWFISSYFKKSRESARTTRKKRTRVRGIIKKKFPRCRDLDFFWSVLHKLEVDNKAPTFKYYHIKGLHPPIRLEGNCSAHPELPFNRSHLKGAAGCLLKHVRQCLDHLRTSGVYQNSMIFILGDHGTGHFGVTTINHGARDPSFKPSSLDQTLQKVISGAIPLMLVKPFHMKDKSELAISDAPVGLGDISKTILESLEISAEVPGKSIFEIKKTDQRVRRYMYYEGFKQWRGYYKGSIEEYLITGFSWYASSWQKSGRIFPPGGK